MERDGEGKSKEMNHVRFGQAGGGAVLRGGGGVEVIKRLLPLLN